MRYTYTEGSDLDHYCIGFTVIDALKPKERYQNHVCECLREIDAQLICDALNRETNEH